MTVDDMYFQRGKLELRGTVVSENQEDVGNFNEALRTARTPLITSRFSPMFRRPPSGSIQPRANGVSTARSKETPSNEQFP